MSDPTQGDLSHTRSSWATHSLTEGDLIIGLKRSTIGTVVDRTTRFTMLVHLPREDGYGTIARTKNGPALAGYGAITMKNALATTMSTLPEQLRRSLTWDRGKELSAHAAFSVETDIRVYFADPRSPWAVREGRLRRVSRVFSRHWVLVSRRGHTAEPVGEF